MRGEESQQLEFLEGEVDLAAADPDAALRVVQAQRGSAPPGLVRSLAVSRTWAGVASGAVGLAADAAIT